jgi:ribose transport system permease protein
VGSVVASAVGALFLSQLQQFVLATGASAAVQNLVEAGALALAVTIYGLRLRPGWLLTRMRAQPPAGAQSRDGTADPRPGPYNDHRAPVT